MVRPGAHEEAPCRVTSGAQRGLGRSLTAPGRGVRRVGFLEAELASLPDPEGEAWQDAEKVRPGVTALYLHIRDAYRLVAGEDPGELPGNVVQSAVNGINSIAGQFSQINDSGIAQRGFAETVNGAHQHFEGMLRQWSVDIRPHLGRPSLDQGRQQWLVTSQLDEAAALLAVAQEARTTLEALTAKASDLLTQVGTGELAHHYSGQADTHRNSAKAALIAVVATTGILVVVGWGVVVTIPETNEWTNLAREVLARLFLVGALTFAVAFTSRIYRVNSHLTVVYEQKAHALRTFSLFARSIQDDDSRGMVLAELVRAVFAPAETGLVDASPEHTVIESASPLIAALARQRS